jgi:ornithine cyclodeaminase
MISADQVAYGLRFERLVPALREAFAKGATVPLRHHHGLAQADGSEATLLLMPAWQEGGYLGIKIATIHPSNGRRGLPGVFATYILCDAATGRPLAVLDGSELTARRTAAVSALGASYLARRDASALLIVGAGRVASLLPAALAAVRPIRRVAVWNVRAEGADALAEALRGEGFDAKAAPSLAEAAAEADIVSCATLATEPLIAGRWLRPGTHIDLIGSFTPAMREADDDCIARANIYVDTKAALTESGDLAGPLARGVIGADRIAGTLGQLCAGRAAARQSDDDITLFKAVGTALADLGAASLVHRRAEGNAE